MASLYRDANGTRRILFVCPATGARKTVRLGKMDAKSAATIQRHVEAMVAAKASGQPLSLETAAWVGRLEGTLRERLERVGLIEPIEKPETRTLGAVLVEHFDGRRDVKAATKVIWGHTRRNLIDHFGDDCKVDSVTQGDADDFKQFLIGQGLASTTVHKRLQIARAFFRGMKRRRFIAENPFDDVAGTRAATTNRQRFVTRDETALLTAACPDSDWRTIVALARYGGLRTPSETLSLRWQDIDWAKGRIVVTSPKTEHHPGHETRTIPLFPELRTALSEALEQAPEGAVYVINERFRKSANGPNGWLNANLRTTFSKIIRRAGLKVWPRPFHNLRASRETELVERFPIQVVTAWLGNTPTVAMKHYLMTTDAHFEAAQNPAQQPSEMLGNVPHSTTNVNLDVNPNSLHCNDLQNISKHCTNVKIVAEGFEYPMNLSGNTVVLQSRGTQSGTLAELVAAWPTLDAGVRRKILRIARSNSRRDG